MEAFKHFELIRSISWRRYLQDVYQKQFMLLELWFLVDCYLQHISLCQKIEKYLASCENADVEHYRKPDEEDIIYVIATEE
jgi:hypothetical protein